MKNKFKDYVIFSDLDGTLLNAEKEVSIENKKAIDYFIDNGGRFSIATGRAFEATETYIGGVHVDLPAIVYNGGTIYDCINRKAIKSTYLEPEKMDLVNMIRKEYKELGIEIYCNTDIYVLEDRGTSVRPATKLLNLIFETPKNLFDLQWNKILLVGKSELMDTVEKEFKDKYNVDVIRSGDRFLEILPDNTSKGHALVEVINLYDLDKNKVIAVGDDMNDAEMLKVCGISFCPENASAAVKKYADNITVDNEHHVIKHIVEWIETTKL